MCVERTIALPSPSLVAPTAAAAPSDPCTPSLCCWSPFPPPTLHRRRRRADKGGVVHAGLGKCSFGAEALLDNVAALVAAVLAARPRGVKGGTISGYLLSASLSSTMGPGVPLSVASLVAAAQGSRG